jgi:V/A-type H+-transporting ATPase subunit D
VTAGVRVPEVGTEAAKPSAKFGFAGSDALTDQVMREFLELLAAVGAMAELETSVWKLAQELKKTQRRVNALEQLFIPSYKETRKFITETLEGKELDSFFVLKLVKKQIGERAEAERGG